MVHKRKKYKCDRKVGVNILGREKSSFTKRPFPPGQHGRKHYYDRAPRKSDFKEKLNEKAKLVRAFAIRTVGNLKKIFQEATRVQANTKGSLHGIFLDLLERRLVMAVYRAKFAATPDAARQLISHANVLVNGKVVKSPNYLLKINDSITIKDHMKENNHVIQSRKSPERKIPEYLQCDLNSVTLINTPTIATIPLAIDINLNMIVEFLSQ